LDVYIYTCCCIFFCGCVSEKVRKQKTAIGIENVAKKNKIKNAETVEELLMESDGEDEEVSDEEEADEEEEEEDEEPNYQQHWQFGVPPRQQNKEFTGLSGVRHTLPPETSTPFDYFCLFLPVYLWTNFAIYTNTKAAMDAEKKGGKCRQWKDTCGAEIKAWVACVIMWCLSKSLSMEKFLKGEIDVRRVSSWFPLANRFENIKRFFKISDPLTDPEKMGDRLHKVREVWETFLAACKANYWPGICVALDEAIKKFKGRCIFKQYIKNKPVKWGIKIYCVCCSLTSYFFHGEFYIGKREEVDAAVKNMSIMVQTVCRLLRPLQGFNHRVYMDNFYTSIPVFTQLARMLIWSTGTIRTNRKYLDKEVTIKKADELRIKKLPLGFQRYSSSGPLLYLAWYDKRPVHMLTNCHTNDQNTSITHWYDAKKGKEGAVNGKIQREVPIPDVLTGYRANMGAVDTFDQYRSYIRLEMRSSKYWHPMWWFILESALVNSWVLYKETRTAAGLPLTFDHFQFRKSIALALAAQWESMGCASREALSPGNSFKSVHFRTAKNKHRSIIDEVENGRFSSADHHISACCRIPAKEGSSVKYRQLYCVHCKTARTVYWCQICRAPLCKTVCFLQFHSPSTPQQKQPPGSL
jgi:hypothetical protein